MRIGVVGAGIAGLSAAHRIKQKQPNWQITIWEATKLAGGKIKAESIAGQLLDVGAESLLNTRPEAKQLTAELGLTSQVESPQTTSAFLWQANQLRPIPATVLGIPRDFSALAKAGVLSAAGLARALLEDRQPPYFLPPNSDVSIGNLISARFGKEVLDRLTAPLLAGVYAGSAAEISLRSVLPKIADGLDGTKSLTQLVTELPPAVNPVLVGIKGGLYQIIDQLVAEFPVGYDQPVQSVRKVTTGWEVQTSTCNDLVDGVVIATPAVATARLIKNFAPLAAHELAEIESASVAVVSLAFLARDLPMLPGSGLLVPNSNRSIKAATWSSQKWQWLAEVSAEKGIFWLRCSLGRHRDNLITEASDAELLNLVIQDLAAAVGISVKPIEALVTRWIDGLPQYQVGHPQKIARTQAAIPAGVALCGAAYSGVGIAATIGSANSAAEKIISDLGATV